MRATLTTCAGMCRRVAAAQRVLFNRMVAAGLPPDGVSYTTLMKSAVMEEDFEAAVSAAPLPPPFLFVHGHNNLPSISFRTSSSCAKSTRLRRAEAMYSDSPNSYEPRTSV